MDYLLERKIRVSTESEYKSLYKWSLFEVDDNGIKTNGDWVPFHWSLWFTAKSVEVHTRLSIEKEQQDKVDVDKSKTTASQKKFISGTFISGCMSDDIDQDNQVRYAIFGTSRVVTEFNLTIKEADEEEGEGCALYALASYESEGATFQMEIEPDYIGFDVCVSKDRLNELINLIETKAVSNIGFYVSGVDGFYSHWTPTIVTSTIKVLSRNCDIVNKEEVNLKIPYVGKVREFNLTFSSKAQLYRVQGDGDNVYNNGALIPETVNNTRHDGVESAFTKGVVGITKDIKGIKLVLWLILGGFLLVALQ